MKRGGGGVGANEAHGGEFGATEVPRERGGGATEARLICMVFLHQFKLN